MAQSFPSIIVPSGIIMAGAAISFFIITAPADPLSGRTSLSENSSVFTFSPAQSIPSLDTLRETRTRPLFNSTRKPPEVSAPAQIENTETISIDDIRLVGTRALGEKRAGLIVFGNEKDAAWFEEGQTLDGWTLERVDQAMIELSDQNDRVEIWLEGRRAVDDQ